MGVVATTSGAGGASTPGSSSAGPLTPPSNGSWSQPAWFIDPSGANGGSDANSGTTVGSPLRTYRRLTQLWGTVSPVLSQTTTITFLSSHPDGTDPVILRPIIEAGALIVQGRPSILASTTITALSAMNTTTGQVLSLNTASGLLGINQLLENTTALKSSRAFTYAVDPGHGGQFKVTRPLTKVDVTVGFTTPTAVDTWALGDTVNILSLPAVNIVEATCTLVSFNGAFQNPVTLYQLNVADPTAAFDQYLIGPNVWQTEMSATRFLAAVTQDPESVWTNVLFIGGWVGGGGASADAEGLTLIGGASQGLNMNSAAFEAGFIVYGGGSFSFVMTESCIIRNLCVDVGCTLVAEQDVQLEDDATFGNSILWGLGVYDQRGFGRTVWPTAHTAASVFTVSALHLNGGTTATSATAGYAFATVILSAGALDAAAGGAGFGGRAFNLGGGAYQKADVL